ncbi:MAG: hypothetical protein ABIH28_01010 [archaeon]
MAKKGEKRRVENKYTRREVLKASARIGAGAAAYGTLGHFLGRGYDYLKEIYRENIQVPKEKIERELHNFGGKYDNAKRKAKIFVKGEQAVVEEENRAWEIERQRINRQRDEGQKEIGRRGFLKSLGDGYLKQLHNKPIPTLTLTGAAYGASKSTIRAIPRYLSRKEIAVLKDKNSEYGERIDVLEDYKKRMEESDEKNTKEIRSELERVGWLLDNARRASGKLEVIAEEDEKRSIPLAIVGLVGLFVFFAGNISKINGFVVGEYFFVSSMGLSFLLLLFSLTLIYFGTKRKKVKIIHRHPYKFAKKDI